MNIVMKNLLLAALLALTVSSAAHADAPEPLLPSAESDSRIRELTYSDDDVYTITTKYGYQTNIVFGKGEEIQTVSVGDRSLWQLIPAGSRLFIRPMAYGIETNMTLITNKHSYQFDLKSLADDKSGGNIYVARFTYPDNNEKHSAMAPVSFVQAAPRQPAPGQMPIAAPPPAPPANVAPMPFPNAQPAPTGVAPAPFPNVQPMSSNFNYNYTYTGSDTTAPLKAYDDGKSTYIQYRPDQPLPSVYMVDANGNATPVSYDVENNAIVINKVAGEWKLEANNGPVYLYNEVLNPD